MYIIIVAIQRVTIFWKFLVTITVFFNLFFIEVSKGNNNWLVKLDDIAKAYRTPAVKEAVNKIAEELEE